jgi:hypothetical protein
MSQASLVPPRFAVTASQFLHDRDLPDHLYRTYARITSLAWRPQGGAQRTYEKTPPLTLYDLETLWGISVRNLRRHITELRKRGCLGWETIVDAHGLHRLAFFPLWPDSPSADGTSPSFPPQDLAPAPSEDVLSALTEFDVDVQGSFARQVAALPHVTPALVHTWGTHLRQRPGIHNLPGLLLHTLQRHTEPPPEVQPAPLSPLAQAPLPEPTGALAEHDLSLPKDHPPARQGLSQAASVSPESDLPRDLEQALRDLGWSGDNAWAEVAGVLSRQGPDFVRAWVEYVQDHPNLGAGFLRKQLRGTTWPSQGKDLDERRRERWQAQCETYAASGPLQRTGSPREETLARYGITPETMQVWERAQAELALQMTRATYDTWLRSALLLSLEDGRATLGVRHAYAADWLQNRLDKVILRTLSRCLDRPVENLAVVLLADIRKEQPCVSHP